MGTVSGALTLIDPNPFLHQEIDPSRIDELGDPADQGLDVVFRSSELEITLDASSDPMGKFDQNIGEGILW